MEASTVKSPDLDDCDDLVGLVAQQDLLSRPCSVASEFSGELFCCVNSSVVVVTFKANELVHDVPDRSFRILRARPSHHGCGSGEERRVRCKAFCDQQREFLGDENTNELLGASVGPFSNDDIAIGFGKALD